MDTTKLIKNIMDVPGIEGICFHDLDGNLLYAQMPSFMIEEVYEDLLRRVVMLYEAVETHYVPVEDYLLKYHDMHLLLRKGQDFGLLILAQESVNHMSLRMVTTMAVRQLTLEALQQAGEKTTPAPSTNGHAPTSPPLPAEPAPAPEPQPNRAPRTARPARLYRGRTY